MSLRGERELIRALRRDDSARPYTTTAKVRRIAEDGTVWARLDGADRDTPVATARVECKAGDTVEVAVSHKDTRIKGNLSSPAATVRTVTEVRETVSTVKNAMHADFARIDQLEATRAQVRRLRADMASIGDLDVEGVLTLKGTIRQIDESLTEAMNSIWGHYEEATAPLRDDAGNLVLDENGNVIPVTKKVWVTDAAMIAERLESDPAKWTGLAYDEMALQLAHESVAKRLGDIEAGVRVSDDPENPFITIGRLGSRATLAMTNEAIELAAEDDFGNVKHAFRVTSEATSAERLEVTNYMKVGRYAFVPRMDGGLALQYVG